MRVQFIDASALASVLEITERMARKAMAQCAQGHPYRSWRLTVISARGRGGAGGVQYRVAIDDNFPAEYRARALELIGAGEDTTAAGEIVPAAAAPLPAPDASPSLTLNPGKFADALAERERRLSIIGPAAMTPPKSQARGAAIAAAALASGESKTTIRRWLRDSDDGQNPGAIMPKVRSRRGKYNHITRAWDSTMRAAGVSDEIMAEIASELRERIKNLFRTYGEGAGTLIARYASDDLYELCQKRGVAKPGINFRRCCELTRHFVEDFEHRRHTATHVFLKDAKAFSDQMPAVREWRDHLTRPLETLVGDCTAVDIRFLRPDGSEFKMTMIGWRDDWSGRFFCHVHFRDKGEGTGQAEVAYSFALVAAEFGMPELVYIDNGQEFGFLESNSLFKVRRALPYGARAKSIESTFKTIIHSHLCHITGFMGSDRMNKKIATVGRPTTPFPGTGMQLMQQIYLGIDAYNSTPQKGLDGLSPNEMWQKAEDQGWRRRAASAETLIESIAKPQTARVKQGEVRDGRGRRLTSDALRARFDLEGKYVTVRVPPIPDLPASVFDEKGRFVCIVHENARDRWLYDEGAKEAGRIKQLRRQGARDLAGETEGADIAAYQRRYVEFRPAPAQREPGEVLRLTSERGKAVKARKQTPAQREAQENELQREQDKFLSDLSKGLELYKAQR